MTPMPAEHMKIFIEFLAVTSVPRLINAKGKKKEQEVKSDAQKQTLGN